MEPNLLCRIRRVLVLKAERVHAEALALAARATLPLAAVVPGTRLRDAEEALRDGPLDLLVSGLGFSDGDMLDFLFERQGDPRAIAHVLVATPRRDARTFEGLARLRVDGVYDTGDGSLAEFSAALRAVAAGAGYWSAGLDLGPRGLLARKAAEREEHLTPVEQLVFSVIGDGCDDKVAAARLGLRESSVHSVRRELHRKLGAQHRGELIRLAAQRGYVRFTAESVQYPGQAILLAQCAEQRARRQNRSRAGGTTAERAAAA